MIQHGEILTRPLSEILERLQERKRWEENKNSDEEKNWATEACPSPKRLYQAALVSVFSTTRPPSNPPRDHPPDDVSPI
jgi:hypothetical protein